MGGSMCNQDEYRWKKFDGSRVLREPYKGLWYAQPGLTQSRGFGMFEIIDLCNIIGCQPLITINNQETSQDMADFVEYCYGSTSSNVGQYRANDGHPHIYNVTEILSYCMFFEIFWIFFFLAWKCMSYIFAHIFTTF